MAVNATLVQVVHVGEGERCLGPLDRCDGPLLGEVTKLVVAASAEANMMLFAATHRHWTGAGKGLDAGRGREPTAMVAKLDQQGRRQKRAEARQRSKGCCIGMGLKQSSQFTLFNMAVMGDCCCYVS